MGQSAETVSSQDQVGELTVFHSTGYLLYDDLYVGGATDLRKSSSTLRSDFARSESSMNKLTLLSSISGEHIIDNLRTYTE